MSIHRQSACSIVAMFRFPEGSLVSLRENAAREGNQGNSMAMLGTKSKRGDARCRFATSKLAL
jgi:hypothetical protein